MECEKGSSILYLADDHENELVGKTPWISPTWASAWLMYRRTGWAWDLWKHGYGRQYDAEKAFGKGRGPLADRRPPRSWPKRSSPIWRS
jgi:hypothetical protein